jgi:2-C-methyl-D-erythritol 2,4-cyclodiphosphate synthase
MRIGNGYDVHALAEGRALWLGGVRIEHSKGCVAHSDGDAAIHALCDALLGAAALGDIGVHFPDTDPEFKGIDSKILLSKVMDLLKKHHYIVVNVDITICLQRPKIKDCIPAMRQALAGAMGIEVGQVSVKATTTERLGFVGREEGVAAYAVALIDNALTDKK